MASEIIKAYHVYYKNMHNNMLLAGRPGVITVTERELYLSLLSGALRL